MITFMLCYESVFERVRKRVYALTPYKTPQTTCTVRGIFGIIVRNGIVIVFVNAFDEKQLLLLLLMLLLS